MTRHPEFRHIRARSADLDGAARLMEKRAIIAALLMAGLLILYQTLFFHPSETPPAAPSKTEAPVAAKPAAPSAPAPVGPSTAAAAPVPVPLAAVPFKTAPVLGPLFKAQVSSHGGDLAAW